MNNSWNYFNKFSYSDLDIVYYYNIKNNLSYQDILNVWSNFIEKKFYGNEKILDLKDKNNISTLKLSIFETKLGIVLDSFFDYHVNCTPNDLILIYIKNSNKILYMLKTYEPLIDFKKISLPFWDYLIDDKEFAKKLDKYFTDDKNIMLLAYSN